MTTPLTAERLSGPPSQRLVEDRRLAIRYREHGDLAARDELTRRLMPLARQLAARYRSRGEPLEDLVQVASMGLVKAIDRFEPERGTALSTYAVPTIMGELRRHFRDSTWSVHVVRSLQERIRLVERESVRLASRLGRSPSVAELSAELGLEDEDVVEALQASSAYKPASLDETIEGDEGTVTLGDTLRADDNGYALAEDRWTVNAAMIALDGRDREILRLRFDKDMTQSEIANELGISQMHVSRLLRAALAKLRAAATADVQAA